MGAKGAKVGPPGAADLQTEPRPSSCLHRSRVSSNPAAFTDTRLLVPLSDSSPQATTTRYSLPPDALLHGNFEASSYLVSPSSVGLQPDLDAGPAAPTDGLASLGLVFICLPCC